MVPEAPGAADGVRLLSHRPSILFKVEHLATEPTDGDIATRGLCVAGPGWDERLKAILGALTAPERAGLWAVRLDDEQRLPLPAQTVLDRARTDWFPEFLSHGQMAPVFQPIVDLQAGTAYGREALVRGRLGALEVRGGELLAAAEAHDAMYSFDARARMAALEVGLPLLPQGEVLFVKLDPRGVLDVEGSLRTTWPAVERVGAAPSAVCLELGHAERVADRELLVDLATAHRERGALIALDDLSGGPQSLAALEALRPDVAKLDLGLTKGIELSASRRRLLGALADCAHDLGAKVVAEGVERVEEFEAMRDLGCEYGQGFYFGMPADRPMPVDPRLVRQRVSLVEPSVG
jgi:EAL domain-containing protein (putative c-di-GMP-specific phosphodiesterase class I)